MNSVRVLLAHNDQAKRDSLAEMLQGLNHELSAKVLSRAELLSTALDDQPDLIVCCFRFPDGLVVDTLVELCNTYTVPSVVIARSADTEDVERAMEDHVMAYMVEPVNQESLEAAIIVVRRRFQEMRELKSQVEDLKEALKIRKIVERAKGILIAGRGMTEEEAYLHLRDSATRQRVKMVIIAEKIIEGTSENPYGRAAK